MPKNTPEEPIATEVEVPAVDESAYPDRPYSEAVDPAHLAFLQEQHPEQIG